MDLKKFLKTYTAIPNKFIDEYYAFYEMCKNNIHGIEASLVIKYLGLTNSKKFNERLRTTYVLNNDYVIKKTNKRSEKDVPNVYYYISFDCFEKICMMSRSEKGNKVRDYFITLRKFIDYYRQQFADGINKLAETGKYVYIILVNKGKNILKFGGTENMRKRLRAYATGKDKHPDIYFIMIVKDPKIVESCVKVLAKNNRYKTSQELYKIDFDTLKSVAFGCAVMNKQIFDSNENAKKYDAYIVYDETKDATYIDLNSNPIGYEKGVVTIKSKKKNKINNKNRINKITQSKSRNVKNQKSKSMRTKRSNMRRTSAKRTSTKIQSRKRSVRKMSRKRTLIKNKSLKKANMQRNNLKIVNAKRTSVK